ncbi:MAG: 16S rRNA (uracil(1498)-N(3))-methyltransferase [Bacteroidales bacterium]|nr:16S rRNA (uracil(1498)-N(3))-methyltransferase [Bacteroidales bacterium]
MQIFYTVNVSEGKALFSREESIHCLRVLRMRRGESIRFTDGLGNLYEGVIEDDDPTAMTTTVMSVEQDQGRRGYRLHMAISPLKNEDRLEWFIEKAVETGIDEITPLVCSRTEKRRIRRERLQGLILSAMKQSVKCYLPRLNDPATFDDFVDVIREGKKIIACCDPDVERIPITSSFSRGEDVTILIGPEGDFTAEEVARAVKGGFAPVHIGPSRLRTETAGVAACCSVYLANI